MAKKNLRKEMFYMHDSKEFQFDHDNITRSHRRHSGNCEKIKNNKKSLTILKL